MYRDSLLADPVVDCSRRDIQLFRKLFFADECSVHRGTGIVEVWLGLE
jgi:hypothetical protein